jgi:hypothetical protein
MTEKLPGDFGANWSPKIVAVVAVGLAVIGGAAYYLPLWNAQRTVAARLIDPESVLFREVRRGQDAICGEFNGKNRFGGYTGFGRFIVTGSGLVFMDAPEDQAASKRWASYC